MIIVKLMGGLGNQMFQYAVAHSLCFASKNKLRVDLDFFQQHDESTDAFTARVFELNIFKQIQIQSAKRNTLNLFLKEKLFYRLMRKICYPHRKIIRQTSCNLPIFPVNTKNLYLEGYFQSEKYFRHIRKTLLSNFTFPQLDERNRTVLRLIENSENSVNIHIRRGDYTKKAIMDYHGILPITYYETAIRHLSGQTSGNLNFFVFTDDPQWVRHHFLFIDNVHIIEGNTGKDSWKDMDLMTHCKHHIVANSSFSWWGAWLCRYEDKIVIAPERWNKAMSTEMTKDLIPDKWTILPIID
jgi:hypothetical protein